MVSVMPSAVSGLTKQEAPSAAVVPAGSGRHSLTLRQRYCAYIAPPIMATVFPISAFAASDEPVLMTTPAPSLPTGIDSSRRAAIPFMPASGTFAVMTGCSLVPVAFAVVMSAAPVSNPRSDGLIGVASTRTTTSSAPGSGVGMLTSDISSSPLFLTSERNCSPVSPSRLPHLPGLNPCLRALERLPPSNHRRLIGIADMLPVGNDVQPSPSSLRIQAQSRLARGSPGRHRPVDGDVAKIAVATIRFFRCDAHLLLRCCCGFYRSARRLRGDHRSTRGRGLLLDMVERGFDLLSRPPADDRLVYPLRNAVVRRHQFRRTISRPSLHVSDATAAGGDRMENASRRSLRRYRNTVAGSLARLRAIDGEDRTGRRAYPLRTGDDLVACPPIAIRQSALVAGGRRVLRSCVADKIYRDPAASCRRCLRGCSRLAKKTTVEPAAVARCGARFSCLFASALLECRPRRGVVQVPARPARADLRLDGKISGRFRRPAIRAGRRAVIADHPDRNVDVGVTGVSKPRPAADPAFDRSDLSAWIFGLARAFLAHRRQLGAVCVAARLRRCRNQPEAMAARSTGFAHGADRPRNHGRGDLLGNGFCDRNTALLYRRNGKLFAKGRSDRERGRFRRRRRGRRAKQNRCRRDLVRHHRPSQLLDVAVASQERLASRASQRAQQVHRVQAVGARRPRRIVCGAEGKSQYCTVGEDGCHAATGRRSRSGLARLPLRYLHV